MTLDIIKTVDIIEIMENYLETVRPPEEIRQKVDIGYEIINQSIILYEIRPKWKNVAEIMTIGYAKTTFLIEKNIWKVFWKKSDGKWYSYKPCQTVKQLSDFLKLVDEDKYGCFHG